MDVAQAVALFWDRVERSSLRRVAKEVGVGHTTAAGWKGGTVPEGENREKILAWAESVSAAVPPTPEVLQRAHESTRRNLVRLSEISGYAKSVLQMMEAVTEAQREVVRGLAPWVVEEEASYSSELRDAQRDVMRDAARVAQGKSAPPKRRKTSGQ